MFKKFGLSLAVPICELPVEGGGSLKLPFLKVSDFLELLLRRHPELVFGGSRDGRNICRQFWQNYKLYQSDHCVFTTYEPADWEMIVPILIHGDKGRGYAKSPIFNFSFESPFGLPPELLNRLSKTERNRKNFQQQEHGGRLSWSCGKRAAELMNPDPFDDKTCPK